MIQKALLVLGVALLAGTSTSHAVIALSGSGTYSQNFNVLSLTGTSNAWTNDSTIPGWFSNRTVYIGSAGTSNSGGLHAIGSGGDAALSGIGSNSSGTIFFGVTFQNNTGAALNLNTLSFAGEQWRNGGNTSPQTLEFSFQIGSTAPGLTDPGYTDGDAFDFTSPVTGATAAAIDGNGAGRTPISGNLDLTLAAGEFITLRWERPNSSGNDHGIGIDDLSLSYAAVPEPGTVLLLGVGGLLAVLRLRRRRATVA